MGRSATSGTRTTSATRGSTTTPRSATRPDLTLRPGRREQVTFEHNVSREDGGGILLQNSTDSSIVENEIMGAGLNAIAIGGANGHLVIRGNRAPGMSMAGIRFVDTGLFDLFRFLAVMFSSRTTI